MYNLFSLCNKFEAKPVWLPRWHQSESRSFLTDMDHFCILTDRRTVMLFLFTFGHHSSSSPQFLFHSNGALQRFRLQMTSRQSLVCLCLFENRSQCSLDSHLKSLISAFLSFLLLCLHIISSFLFPLFQATLIFSDLRSSSQLPVPLLPPLFPLMPLLLHQHLPSPNLTFLSQTQVTSNISPKFCSPIFSSSVLVSLSSSNFSYFLLHLLFSALPLFFLRCSEGLAGIRCRNHPRPPAE